MVHDSKNINQILGLNSPESIRLFINRSFSDLRFSSAELVNCSFASNLGVLIIFLLGNFLRGFDFINSLNIDSKLDDLIAYKGMNFYKK